MNGQASVLTGEYDAWLVTVSILIAVSASYTALGLASRTTVARGRKRLAWLAGGAVAMGFGIWSMHYVGMLAFALPVPVRYDLPTVVVSLLAAIFASGVALFVVSREQVGAILAGIGSLFMGAGIIAMHYIGMEAMRLPAMCEYNNGLLVLSCVIAVAGSLAAMWLTFHLRARDQGAMPLKVLSALAMGAAIAAMHYTGMSAATFRVSREVVDYSHAVNVSDLGVTGIVIVTFLVLAFAFFTSMLDQQLSAQMALGEELYRSRQMLQSILDNIPQRVFWKDPNGQYLGCNMAFATDASIQTPDQVVGKTDEMLGGFAGVPRYSSELYRTLETGTPVLNSEHELTSADGVQRWIRASAIALRDSTGKICGVLGTYEDITEHKRAEDAIRRSNTALSEFAHVVSHDLQSPLRVANNLIQLLSTKYATELDEDAGKILGLIESGLRSMSDLIQSLLQFASATELEPEGQAAVPFSAVLDLATANSALLIAESGAQITSDPMPDVVGYRLQLTQVVQNLISNAIKYRKPDVMPRIHVGANERNEEWVISVRDNGIGIAPAYHGRVFDPLKRLHGAEIPGFGIGLATCHKVVEHHGGRIWLESEPGVGSTFYFSLPKRRGADDSTVGIQAVHSIQSET